MNDIIKEYKNSRTADDEVVSSSEWLYDILVNVKIKVNWQEPAKTVTEECYRQKHQIRADYIAYKFEQLLKKYIEAQNII